jgi:hypothetical protein
VWEGGKDTDGQHNTFGTSLLVLHAVYTVSDKRWFSYNYFVTGEDRYSQGFLIFSDTVLPNLSFPIVLSWFSCQGCPFKVILSRLSCPSYPVSVVLPQLSCPGCPVPVALSSCPVVVLGLSWKNGYQELINERKINTFSRDLRVRVES